MKKSTMVLILVLVLTSSLHAVMGLNGGIFQNSHSDQNNADPFDMNKPNEYFIVGGLKQNLIITFQVDMTLQIWNGWFVPGADTSAVSGSMNGWNKWELTDVNGDEIYTGEYSFYGSVSDVIEYKYRINDNFELFKEIYSEYELLFFKYDDRFRNNQLLQQQFVQEQILKC